MVDMLLGIMKNRIGGIVVGEKRGGEVCAGERGEETARSREV